jgi:hypothetical protein
MFFGFKEFVNPHDLFALTNLNSDDLADIIAKKKFLGFQAFRDTDKLQTSFQAIIDNPIFAKHIDDGKVASLITLIDALRVLNENIKHRKNLYKDTSEVSDELLFVKGQEINPANPSDSYLLLKTIDEEKGVVIDSAHFAKYRESYLLKYFKVPEDQVFVLMLLYQDIFKAVDEVIDNWDKMILLNPSNI